MSLYHQDKTDGSTKTGTRTVRLWRKISTCSGANIDRVQCSWIYDVHELCSFHDFHVQSHLYLQIYSNKYKPM